MTLYRLFKRQCIREFTLCHYEIKHTLNALMFFFMVAVFFPLSMPAELNLIQKAVSSILWIALLFAVLLMSEKLFYEDVEEGVVEQWIISGYPLTLFVYAKLIANGVWLIAPLILFSPLLALLFSMPLSSLYILDCSFILGTPALLALGALSNAFTQGVSQKGLLMAIILLPLTLPVLIFGSGLFHLYEEGSVIGGYYAILASVSLLCFGLLPFAIAAVLKAQH